MMHNKVVRGITTFLMATGILATTAFAAPPKIQLQYLAFPATCVGGSTGSMQLVMVNNGPTGSVTGSDHVLVSVPLGSQAEDLLATATGLSCGADNALWNCMIDSITATAATVRFYPASGTVSVAAGETLYFYLDNTQINAAAGMAMLDVTQNIDPSRATSPVNTQMSVLKVTQSAAAYLEIDPTVPANIKDGVDWTELANVPAGFLDGVDNVGLTAETDPTVPAFVKDGVISWTEISGIPTSLQNGVTWGTLTGIPASFADGVDDVGLTAEIDPQVGSNTTNRVPKWDGSALVSSSSINENASGNVGIGTANPNYLLEVSKKINSGIGITVSNTETANGAYSSVNLITGGSSAQVVMHGPNSPAPYTNRMDFINNTPTGDIAFRTNSGGNTVLAALSNGNVGIGTTNPSSVLHIRASGNAKLQIEGEGVTSTIIGHRGGFNYDAPTGKYHQFTINGADKVRIDSSGNVGIDTTSPGYKLDVNGNSANTTGVWAVRSDARLKRDIAPISGALQTVTALQGVGFNWKDDAKNNQFGRVMGFIAQDVEKVLPQWVQTDADGYKRIETIGMNALLVEALKEQQQKFDAQINDLRNQIKELRDSKK